MIPGTRYDEDSAAYAAALTDCGSTTSIRASSGHGRCLRYPVLAEPGACGGRCLHWRHRIGFICGSTFAFIPHSTAITAIIVYSLAVGTCVFLIVALDAEHPPAGGTALDVAITGFSVSVMVAVLTSSIMLSLAHRFCKKYLKDLT